MADLTDEKHFDPEAKAHIAKIMNGGIVETASRNGVVGAFVGVLVGYAIGSSMGKSKLLFAAIGGVTFFIIGTSVKK